MKWIAKAITQAILSVLPYGENINRILQKLNKFDKHFENHVIRNIRHLMQMRSWIQRDNFNGCTVVEVGTGWIPTVPLALSLWGVVHSYDHMRHLRQVDLDKTSDILSKYYDLSCLPSPHFEYHAPGDAAQCKLPDDSIDLHISIAVFEHIPVDAIRQILKEAKRIMKPGGLLYHHIGLHDHFADFEPALTYVNFLKFSNMTWKLLGQNKMHFHNRLRASDFVKLFSEYFTIVRTETKVSKISLNYLETTRVLDFGQSYPISPG
jgi:ubiquinone/menaquinone biosynthesis C-methylase UbiE